jgi:HAMP domain-containing protein
VGKGRALTRFAYLCATAVGLTSGLSGALVLGRYLDMSGDQQLVQIIVSEAFALCAVLFVWWRVREDRRAVTGVPSVGAELSPVEAASAWMILAEFPGKFVRRATPVGVVVTAVIGVFGVVNVGAPWWSVLPVVAGGEIAVLSGMAVILFLFEQAARPRLKSLATALPSDFTPPERTRSLRLKTLPPLPLFTLGAAVVVGAFPATAHSGAVRLSIVYAIALPPVLVAAGLFLLVIRSLLDPIAELTAATRRAGEGDLSTPVPVATVDELGALGASFNQMLEGLREREALRDEVLRREDELRASRARIVAASDAERRRVERNIHDGAQQQLVALAVKLRMLEDRVGDDPDLRDALGEIGERLKSALQDLRELARGLHPSILTTDGLLAALEQPRRPRAVPGHSRWS